MKILLAVLAAVATVALTGCGTGIVGSYQPGSGLVVTIPDDVLNGGAKAAPAPTQTVYAPVGVRRY